MARTRELSLAFAETHPSDAARVLEHLPVTDATAFLTLLPARLGAPVLRHMLPTSAARFRNFPKPCADWTSSSCTGSFWKK